MICRLVLAENGHIETDFFKLINSQNSTRREMSRNVEKCREMPRNVEKCRDMSRNVDGARGGGTS